MKIRVSSLSLVLLFVAIGLLTHSVGRSAALSKGAPKSVAVIDSVLADSARLKDRVVYVDFWASWCAPCGQSFPWMNRLQGKYGGKGLSVITINLDKHSADADDFIDRMRSTLDVVYDSTGTLAKRFALGAIPSSFIYDRSGNLRSSHPGFQPTDTTTLDSLVNALVNERKGQ